ncbi:MAG: cell division protein FtsZ [Crocinitomicaceae bacterium]|jgi:cell division protein FtsZ|nr:cell division protein FtsZ [Crocinitomicaceae bacterium]MDP4724039.1 cell division protein FtsZ [Crocinitomicaceae bacterium]MDP4739279.1 cell division protein FtsZ [Crocinitomicaceae bacterium]MDP4805498.1 cell division protein FtsZ [Crocinitomicaceae bacterium]MDP4868457.1 cell division protein FtsZ [Crocinitomicaceae bacterium]
MEFDLPKHDIPQAASIIKVIGVGGGGSNAVNHMYLQGIAGVDFIVCNTDCQALDLSPVPHKIQLGPNLTEGRGAGMIPEVGMNAAMENIQEIRELLSKDTKMVFVTAGMGGGTGTGAAPVIAQVAKDLGILTVGIVTVPFNFEGRKRRQQAEEGLERMRQNVDTLLIINNERLREFGKNMSLSEAFSHADDVLTVAAKGIAEVISVTGAINVDFNDVNTVMRNSGKAIMGSATAAGEDRAVVAVKNALNSPLLYDNDISGARYVLLNISYGDREVMMDEITEITDYIQEAAGSSADVIWGHGQDASLGDQLSLTIIATGFSSSPLTGSEQSPERTVVVLEEERKQEITAPLSSPFESTAAAPAANVTEEPFMKQVEAPLANPFQTTEAPIDAVAATPKTTFNLYDEQEAPALATQTSMSWEVFDVQSDAVVPTPAAPSFETEVVKHVLEDDSQQRVEMEMPKRVLSPEEQQRKNQERVSRIQEFTSKLKKPEGLLEFENEPAFVRRNIQLQQQDPSTQEAISRFGIGKDANGNSTLRNNNFLHDNVD